MLLWLHIVSCGLFLGATAGLALFSVPRAREAVDASARRRALARTLRVYDPLAIGLLGVAVMTGAWGVTAYKQTLGQAYFVSFGVHLAWKLALAFLVVMAGTYLCFGLGHRLVRQEEWGDPVDPERLDRMLARLNIGAWLTVVLTLATVGVALRRAG